MKVVNRVWKTAHAAEAPVALAAERYGGWKLLRKSLELPRRPMPMLGADSRKRRSIVVDEEPAVTLSILITKKDVWIGLSRVMDIRQMSRVGEPQDSKQLADALAEMSKSKLLSASRKVEIGAADPVTYAVLVAAIDVINDAGREWKLVQPAELTVRFP
jgi:hypothetical protein